MLTFAFYLIALFLVQTLLQAFLGEVLGIGIIGVWIISDLIFAMIFALIEYPGPKSRAWKDSRFYKKVISIFLFFTLITVLEFLVSLFLSGVLQLSYIWVLLIVNFLISVAFSIYNYPGLKRDAIKDPRFHSRIAIYFTIFTLFTLFEVFRGI